ncbi:MAG: FAD:protein FMN transferase [bacterium]|nr:FAD:protein FMN transferase [bacterium]
MMNTVQEAVKMGKACCLPALIVILFACGGPAPQEPTTPPLPEQTDPQPEAPTPDSSDQSAPTDHSDQPEPAHETFMHRAMGTQFEFTLYAREGDTSTGDLAAIAEQAFAAVDALEGRISRYQPTSQLTYLNNHAAEKAVRVAPDIRDLLVFVKKMYEETDGAFDPTVGPLIKLWGFYKGEGRLPTQDELDKALASVGMDKVAINADERTAEFLVDGMMLDFGGIGKGLALDKAAQVLRNYGVTRGILHVGTSTVLAIGAPPGESGWTVRIRDPYNNERYIDEVILKDESLSTSGSYEKFFELDGKEYCHIFDPRTGNPVQGTLSVTAIAKDGTTSDALSTSFFVMGEDKARDYCQQHPEVRAVFVPIPVDSEPEARRIEFPAQEEQP